jgi:FKBP-type peptidyl-prolyl cis-trans isomerase 2
MKLLFSLSTFLVSYTARLEDGTIFEKKGIHGEQPLEFITDEGQFYP